MRVEQYEEDGKLVVRVDAAGIDPETDADDRVVDGTLQLRVDRHASAERAERPGYRTELR